MSISLRRNPVVVGVFPTIANILFGCDVSSMSGQLNNQYYLDYFGYPNSSLQGGIVAAMPAGSFAGALINSYAADRFGRKNMIIAVGVLWCIGCIIQAAANGVPALVAGRVISGIGVGIGSSVVPVYQAEITKAKHRGSVVATAQLAITVGIMLQYFVQFGGSYINSNASFRLPWALQLIPGIILSFGMLFLPESPRYLMDHGKSDECLNVLADVHGDGKIDDELVQFEFLEIKEAMAFDKMEAAKSYADLFAPGIARRVGLGMSLQMWSQLTGMNVMMYYSVYLFQSAGITGRQGALIASAVQYSLNVIFTIPAVIYIDKWGRRPMLLYGSLFMSIWLFLVGGLMGRFGELDTSAVSGATTTWIIVGNDGITRFIICCSYFFVMTYAMTYGPVSWTYPSEIFPMKVRAKAVSLSTSTNWIFNFCLAYAVPPALQSIQFHTYFIFGGFCALMTAHVFFCFPETKGRTLEEMDSLFSAGHEFTAWRLNDSTIGKRSLSDVKNGIPVEKDEEESKFKGTSEFVETI